MGLKGHISKEEFAKLPADVQKEYKLSDDGVYDLDLESLPRSERKRFEEFRDTNIKRAETIEQLTKDLKALQGEVDPKLFKQMKEELAQIKNGSGEAFEKVVGGRITALQSELNAQLDAHKKRGDEFEGKYRDTSTKYSRLLLKQRLDEAIADLPKGVKVREKARAALSRAIGEVFYVTEDGLVKSRNPETGQPLYNGKAEEMTLKEYIVDLRKKEDIYFEQSTGGGSGGDGPTHGPNGSLTIRSKDAAAKSANLEKIASGEVTTE